MKRIALLILSLLVLGSSALVAQDETPEEKKHRLRVESLLRDAQFLLNEKRFDQADKAFDEVLKADPQNLDAMVGKTDILGFQKKIKDLQTYVSKTAKAQKQASLEQDTLEGIQMLWDRKIPQATDKLEKTVSKHPKKAYMAHYQLALMLYPQKKYSEALKHLEACLKIKENHAEALFLKGNIHMALGQTKELLDAWNAYLKLIPHQGNRYKLVSTTLNKMGGR